MFSSLRPNILLLWFHTWSAFSLYRRVTLHMLNRRFLQRLSLLFLCSMPGVVAAGPPEDGTSKVYKYKIHHPIYGDIGTYTNTIQKNGTDVSVRNEIRATVKILEIIVHDHKSRSTELWRDGRIVSFEGNTKENGTVYEIRGRAEGEKFIVVGPQGQTEAPLSVFPNNPWSPGILEAKVLMSTKSGKLYRVRSSQGEEKVLKVGAKSLKTKYFKVEGDARYELWFDTAGVPVKFRDLNEDMEITFQMVPTGDTPSRAIMKGSMGSP